MRRFKYNILECCAKIVYGIQALDFAVVFVVDLNFLLVFLYLDSILDIVVVVDNTDVGGIPYVR